MARMRYRLRTLVVVLLLAPPLIAAAVWIPGEIDRVGLWRFVETAEESLGRLGIVACSGATILLIALALYFLWAMLRDYLRDR